MNTPASNFISVDLPAPFSPVIAWTDPAWPAKDTAASAWIEPKRLVTFRNSILGTVCRRGRDGDDDIEALDRELRIGLALIS